MKEREKQRERERERERETERRRDTDRQRAQNLVEFVNWGYKQRDVASLVPAVPVLRQLTTTTATLRNESNLGSKGKIKTSGCTSACELRTWNASFE